MEDCSWLQLRGDAMDSERSYGSSGLLHGVQEVVISAHVQQQLKQTYMLMESEEDKNAATVPTSSPSSSTFRPQDNSSLVLTGGATSTTSPHEPVEVSSLNMSLSPIAYDDNHGLCLGDLDTILNLDGLMTQEAHQEQARRQNGHESRGAFRPYVRHLSPRKKPKPGACGQRAIKAAMSASARMHMTRLALSHWQSVRMNMAAEPSVGNSSYNQAQHVLSERKRREKLNDNFKALRTVLPPGIKKDKTSTLIRARDYVNTLKSRVSELEEKNRMLVESELHGDNSCEQDDYSSEQNAVDIIRAAATGETSQKICLKIAVGSGQNAMDAVATILKHVKEIGDVRLVAMDTGSSSSDLSPGKDVQIAHVTLQVTL